MENYKVLQAAFDKNGIKRHIDVNKLSKARPLDNLEFCQWLKAYFDKNYSGEPYDALTRRKNQDLFYILGGAKVAPIKKAGTGGGAAAASQPAARPAPKTTAPSSMGGASGISKPIGGGSNAANAAEVKKLNSQIEELKLQTDTLDKERDFYFSKLRDIELLL